MRYIAASLLSIALLQAGGTPAPPAWQGRAGQAAVSARERAYRSNNTGVAYLEQFNYQDAERHFREALKIDPALSIARLNLAIAALYAGRPAEAVQEARAAAKQLPDTPQAHFVLALAAKNDDKTEEAIAEFTRVLQLDPADPATKIHLGQIHLQQRRYPEALKLFEEAFAAEPYNVTAAYNVALALTRAGQQEEGRAAMKRFETLRDSPYGVTFAQTYLSQGRYGEAIASTGAEADLVDPAVPNVKFVDATAASLPGDGLNPGTDARLTLFDVDGDGDLDLLVLGTKVSRLLRNQNGVFSDAKIALPLPADAKWVGAVAGDYDNDGRPDLLVLGAETHRLLHQTATGTFEDVSDKAGLPRAAGEVTSGALLDADHDGDLDVLVAGAAIQLAQNNGDGTFTDITARSLGAAAGAEAYALAPTDYDNRRDIDVLALGRDGPKLYRNMRDGSFRDWSAQAGLTPVTTGNAGGFLAVGDVNKDGYQDFFQTGGVARFGLSDGQGQFRVVPAPEGAAGARRGWLFDYDNDGLIDLLTTSSSAALFRNAGQGRWTDVSAQTGVSALGAVADGAVSQPGDLDGDGDTDVVTVGANGVRILRNEGGNRNASLRVRLAAHVSNRSGIGSKVEIRAGSLRQMLETSSTMPPVAPADLVFGLGPRPSADVVRTLWPSGILQAETELAAAAPKGGRRPPLTITELDRKPSSCPYLFTWNGSRFEFITDFMGGGEMGGWHGPGAWNRPDPDEYVRIRADQLQPRDGRYELRMTNELEEALFVDRLQLIAVDHADGTEVHPIEGLRSVPPPFALASVRDAKVPVRATDEHGHDVLSRIAAIDRQYPDDFGLSRVRGYAETHSLVMDLGDVSDRALLLMTGWTDYAFSSDNVAASQHGAAMTPPSLQVKDRRGEWQTVVEETGFPVGRPQTVVVDLAGKFLSASREVRIVTNMRIYWDQVLVASSPDPAPVAIARIEPAVASLSWRGLSQEATPDGREPYLYDYHRPTTMVPWKVMAGRYTREGDVRPLLTRTDDMFVISRPGDEIALSFPALPPVRPGRARTFLLFVHGYSKEMNPRSAVPDTVGPLPFRAMSGYPYGANEHYPRTKSHRDYQERYNTRLVAAPVPSIDTAVLTAGAPAPHAPSRRTGGAR